jgi:hypothetical protein
MKKTNRDKIIERIIRLTWDSLESHLGWTYASKKELGKETNSFHRKCVRDYAETIRLATLLYAVKEAQRPRVRGKHGHRVRH